jgi:DNA-binding GntR family transcriptional regulator
MLTSIALPRHRTKEEYAYDVLRNAILRCELRPGEKIVVDALSVQLGVSPIPVRTALQRLQAEGLVEITPHTGAIVSDISPDQIEQVFLLLEHLECSAFEVAARKATAADVAHLKKIIDEMESVSTIVDSDQWSELNSQFHRYVAGITDMRMLIDFTGRTLDGWDRLRRWYLGRVDSHRIPRAQADHRRMIELFAQRDIPALIALVAQHNRLAHEDYEKLIRELPKPE